MQVPLEQLYLDLMGAVRDRFDVIAKLRNAEGSDFGRAETAAFHGRKIIEGIAFGCLVAVDKGLKHIPRDAKGQWNAETILVSLRKKGLQTFPSPSVLRMPTAQEEAENSVKAIIEGLPERRISTDELVSMYQRMHRWLHELNPYVATNRADFYVSHGASLWSDLGRIEQFVDKHFISIAGQGFFCALRDNVDDTTKLIPLFKAG